MARDEGKKRLEEAGKDYILRNVSPRFWRNVRHYAIDHDVTIRELIIYALDKCINE